MPGWSKTKQNRAVNLMRSAMIAYLENVLDHFSECCFVGTGGYSQLLNEFKNCESIYADLILIEEFFILITAILILKIQQPY